MQIIKMTEKEYFDQIIKVTTDKLKEHDGSNPNSPITGGAITVTNIGGVKNTFGISSETIVATNIAEVLYKHCNQTDIDFDTAFQNKTIEVHNLCGVFEVVNTIDSVIEDDLSYNERIDILKEAVIQSQSLEENIRLGELIISIVESLNADEISKELPVRVVFSGIEESDILTLYVELEDNILILFWVTFGQIGKDVE